MSEPPPRVAANIIGLFNVKAARLERSKFRAYFLEKRPWYSFRKVGDEWHVSWGFPEDEDVVDAFALTLRMFVQERDTISVSRVAQLYHQLPLSEELRLRFKTGYRQWKSFLQAKSTLVSGNKHFSNRQMLQLKLYGDLAHTVRL